MNENGSQLPISPPLVKVRLAITVLDILLDGLLSVAKITPLPSPTGKESIHSSVKRKKNRIILSFANL